MFVLLVAILLFGIALLQFSPFQDCRCSTGPFQSSRFPDLSFSELAFLRFVFFRYVLLHLMSLSEMSFSTCFLLRYAFCSVSSISTFALLQHFPFGLHSKAHVCACGVRKDRRHLHDGQKVRHRDRCTCPGYYPRIALYVLDSAGSAIQAEAGASKHGHICYGLAIQPIATTLKVYIYIYIYMYTYIYIYIYTHTSVYSV